MQRRITAPKDLVDRRGEPENRILDKRILHAIFLYFAPDYWREMEACRCGKNKAIFTKYILTGAIY